MTKLATDRNWENAEIRTCDYCSLTNLTVINSEGKNICAICCDEEYTQQLENELNAVKAKLLAYEQAAKNPVAYRNKFTGQFFTLEQQPNAAADTPVYEPVFLAAPVLPLMSPSRMRERQPISEHSAAIKDVIAERQRQISEEGWLPELDDRYNCGELAGAAACYARYTNARGWVFPTNPADYQSAEESSDWPLAAEWWKPTNPRRDLVKAGALILAEIERQDRAASAQEGE